MASINVLDPTVRLRDQGLKKARAAVFDGASAIADLLGTDSPANQ